MASDVTLNGDNLRLEGAIVEATGRVAIGHANPQRQLHVHGGEIHSSGGGAGLSFESREATNFVDKPAKGERWLLFSTGGKAHLWSGSEKLTVTPSGRVGIAHTDPQRQLHVHGGEIHSSGGGAGLSFENREATGFVDNPEKGDRWVLFATGGTAHLWSGGEKLSVTPGGKVGVGITQPSGQLHVQTADVDCIVGESRAAAGLGPIGVVGRSQGVGVRGESSFGVGVQGRGTGGGVSGETEGGIGVSGTSKSGVGVSGFSESGTAVNGLSLSGPGVKGQSQGNEPAIVAENSGDGPALSVMGKAQFSRSGVAVIEANSNAAVIPVAGLSKSTLVFAILQDDAPDLFVRCAFVPPVPNPPVINILLNKMTTSPARVAWFLVN